MRCEHCWGLTTTEQWLLWLLWAGLPDYTHIIQSSQRGAGGGGRTVWEHGGNSRDISHNIYLLLDIQTKAIRRFVITEKAPTRAFSVLKAATTAFTFKTLLRHYAKRALTPRSLNVKLGPRRKGHKGRAVWLA